MVVVTAMVVVALWSWWGYWGDDDGGDGHICFGVCGGCGNIIVLEYGGLVFILW